MCGFNVLKSDHVPFDDSEAILPMHSLIEIPLAGSNLNKQTTSELFGLYFKSTKSRYCVILNHLTK